MKPDTVRRPVFDATLAVVPSDPLAAYEAKGRGALLANYYNPLGAFANVYCLSPLETEERVAHGMHIIPTSEDELGARLVELGVDVARAYGGYWPATYLCRPSGIRIPRIVSVHDTHPDLLHDEVRNADFVFTVSRAVRSFVIDRGVDGRRTRMLPNRVDRSVFRPRAYEAPPPIERLRRSGHPHVILHVGRKSEEKNLDTLIRSLRHLGRDYAAVFVGPGDAREYEALATAEGVGDRAMFLGSESNEALVPYYATASCVCIPSRREGFGIVFIEALASGAAVVASDIASLGEFMRDGDNALLVKEFENPAVLADAVRAVCEDSSLNARLRAHAPTAAFAFDQHAVDALEVGLYAQILGATRHDGSATGPVRARSRRAVARAARLAREAHYDGRFSAYRALSDVAVFDRCARGSAAATETLEAAGMVDPDLSLYWPRVDFIVQHARGRVLEIGAATGNITRHLTKEPAVQSVVAVERHPRFADHLRALKLPRVEVVAGDALTAPLTGKFDCVVLAEVLEHMTETDEACLRRRLQDLLEDGATVILTTPIGFMEDPDHVRGFSRMALLDHAESAYGRVLAHGDNGVQQFVAVEWRRPVRRGPRVSVLLPTWNHADLLPQAVASVLSQTYSDLELLIVDDGSTDHTPTVLGAIADPRCRTIRIDHSGLPTALNVGTCLARGELLTWTSADNVAHPRWLESLVAALDARPDAAMAFTGFRLVNDGGVPIRDNLLTDPTLADLLCHNPGVASFLYRSSITGEVGLYDAELANAEDWDYWTRVLADRDFVYVPDVLYDYRVHDNSLTAREQPLVQAAARSVLQRTLARLKSPADATRFYPALGECRDIHAARVDALWDFGVRLLRSPLATPAVARPFLELASAARPDPRILAALAALEACEGRWTDAHARLEQCGPDAQSPEVAAVRSCVERHDAEGVHLVVPAPDPSSSELIARERRRRVLTLAPGDVPVVALT